MIIKGHSSTGKGLGAYLIQDKNDRVEIWGTRGDLQRDLKETLDDWRSDSLGTKCTKPLYHAQLNPDRDLSREEWNTALNIFEKEMGLENQPRVIVLHDYKEREHLHVVYSRIDEHGKALSDSWNYLHHEKAAREIERQLGLEKTQGAFIDKEGERPERAPDHADMQQSERTKIDPHQVKAEVSALYKQAETGREFVNALEAENYELARGDRRAYTLVDEAGGIHSLARAAGVKVADLKELLHEYPLNDLQSIKEAQEKQSARLQAQQQNSIDQQHEAEIKQAQEPQQTALHPETEINYDLNHKNSLNSRYLSPEELEKKHNAHLAATLYDRGGMVSQQQDALKDHAERQEKINQEWASQNINQYAPVFLAQTAREQEHKPEKTDDLQDRPDQETLTRSEEFTKANHETTAPQEQQSQQNQEESQKTSQAKTADTSPEKEMTDSRAARLEAAKKYFENFDAELAERQLEQEKGLEGGRDLGLSR